MTDKRNNLECGTSRLWDSADKQREGECKFCHKKSTQLLQVAEKDKVCCKCYDKWLQEQPT